jgi:predicted MFS family arabinose efflux permease
MSSIDGARASAASPGVLDARGTRALAVAGLSLIAVSYGLGRFAYGLFLPVFREEFALDAAAAGVVAAGSYVAYASAVVAAMLVEPRVGARAVAVLAGAAATLGTALIAVAPSALVLAVGVLVAGSSTGLASPPLASAVARGAAEGRRARVQTVINAGTGLGVAVAGPIAMLTGEQWRGAWLSFAVLCAVATAAVAVAVPARTPDATGAGARLLPRPLIARGGHRLIVAALAVGFSSAVVWTYGRDLLTTVGGMTDAASTIAWILLGVAGLLGAAVGDLAASWGLARAWTACLILLAAATGLLAALPSVVAVAWSSAAGFGAAYIATTGLLLLWGVRVYPDDPAAGAGIAFLVLALAQAAGSVVFGALSDIAGPIAAFLAAAVIALLGATLRPASDLEEGRA